MHQDTLLNRHEVERRLRQAGIQPTAQRMALYQFVLSKSQHVTAEQVKTWADDNFPKVSLATVYNTLNLFVDAGLLRALRLRHTDKVIYDTNLSQHYHFLDTTTGKIHDIMPADVTLTTQLPPEFELTGVEILFQGRYQPR